MWFSVVHFQFSVRLHQHQIRCLRQYHLLLFLDSWRLSSVMLHLTFRMTIWMQEHLKLWILVYQSLSWNFLAVGFSCQHWSCCPLLLVVLFWLSHLLFYDASMTLMRPYRWPPQRWRPSQVLIASILFWCLFLIQLQLDQCPAHLLPVWPCLPFVECWCIAWTWWFTWFHYTCQSHIHHYSPLDPNLHSPYFGWPSVTLSSSLVKQEKPAIQLLISVFRWVILIAFCLLSFAFYVLITNLSLLIQFILLFYFKLKKSKNIMAQE